MEGCEIATAVGSDRVVIVGSRLPGLHGHAWTRDEEHSFVEAFVPQPAVEALDICILLRLSRRDVAPLDAVFCDQPSMVSW